MAAAYWTPGPGGRVEQLKSLWEAGLSASQIAGEMGNITRNAIIGKVHRLGLSGRYKNPIQGRPARKPRVRRTIPETFSFRRGAPPSPQRRDEGVPGCDMPPGPAPLEPDEQPIQVQRVTFAQLEDRHCHWPVGDPRSDSLFFCGGPATQGEKYCRFHCLAAYGAEHRVDPTKTYRPRGPYIPRLSYQPR